MPYTKKCCNFFIKLIMTLLPIWSKNNNYMLASKFSISVAEKLHLAKIYLSMKN